ncbi:LysR family transcriptional regulator [Actinoalloteichus fjordicus]|uniref:Transcriptional regulator n=1 Tax=Actinoalloteichus fjordicus TaxID=1612552 RepID=A0AAC9LJQ5_9PSEU|nr:LysR family transcriptional regulator [Actinoalloteichus fjordicus]APU17560.1 transcriptional regulator [Actinoalloteichus fjordicus]
MLDVRRLQVLHAVVTSGSVSSAATDLGFTPSAISQQLATLEREVGMSLLEKAGRGLRPTHVGQTLSDRAGGVLADLADIEQTVADLRAGSTGRVRIRYFATAGAVLVPQAVAEFRREYPRVRLELLLDDVEPLAELCSGRADVALIVQTSETAELPGLRHLPLLVDPYRVVLPRGHRLSSRRSVEVTELAEEQWVDSDRSHGPCREPVLRACAAAGFQPDFAVQTEDYATAQGFVAAGMGVAIMPMLGLGAVHPGVVVRRLRQPEPMRRIALVIRQAVEEQVAVRRLATAFQAVAASVVT